MRGMKYLGGALCLAALSGPALAQETAFDLPLASGPYIRDQEAFRLAATMQQRLR